MEEIAIVDCENDVRHHAHQIIKAIETVGFVYLKNFGFPYQKVIEAFNTGDKLWELDDEVKEKYARHPGINTGFVAVGVEKFNKNNMAEIRQSFNVCPATILTHHKTLPNEEIPGFESAIMSFYDECWTLAHQILEILAVYIGQDSDFFVKNHTRGAQNQSTLRLLQYPPLPDSLQKSVGNGETLIRCGEHSDYGSITLLFQDEKGGLEVRNCHDEWMSAKVQSECVLINTGDLLQRWSSNNIKAVKHRVIVHGDDVANGRRSMAFFMHPNDQTEIEPLDGSNIYSPVTAAGYLKLKFNETYEKEPY